MAKDYHTVVVGIDIGGTTTTFGFVDRRGNILASGGISTKRYPDLEDYIQALYNEVMSVKDRAGITSQIYGIGVGAPCANSVTGEIEGAVNLPWPSPTPLAAKMEAVFKIPVKIANDANAATIGEMMYGAARGIKNFIMLTLGTGIGGGIVADGHLISGVGAMAGELGHVNVRPENGRQCACGRRGCLETYCSATGVTRTAQKMLAASTRESLLRNVDVENITAKDVFDAASKGDAIANEIFEYTGNILGEACANYALFSAPEAIVLFGGLAQAGELIFKPTRESFERNCLYIFKDKIKIIPSELKASDAAILGASAVGW
jgi:glucokinase